MSESSEAAETEERGAAVRIPPPIVPVVMLVLGVAIDRGLAPWGAGPEGLWRWLPGGVLVASGLFLLGAAAGLFRRTGQDPKPWEPSPELILDGVYRYTRNPMYVGMGLLQAGLGLFFASVTPAMLVPVSWWIIHRIAIRHEEAYLRGKFGAEYEVYVGRVRRWL